VTSTSGNQLGQILQSALAESQRAHQAYSNLNSLASSSSSNCYRASSDSISAAWDTPERDVSYLGNSIDRDLQSVEYSHSQLQNLLHQAGSEHGSCGQDLRRALSEVGTAGLSQESQRKVSESINQALNQDGQIGSAANGTEGSLYHAEQSVSGARGYAQQVSNDSEGQDVSSAGRSLGQSASEASSEYEQVSSSASTCSSHQATVSDYIQEALFANVPNQAALTSQENSILQFPEALVPGALPPHPVQPNQNQTPSTTSLGWDPKLDGPAPGFAGFLFSGKSAQ
jgi:hypothetical protein